MKKLIYLFGLVLLTGMYPTRLSAVLSLRGQPSGEEIEVWSTPGFSDLTARLVEEYNETGPEIRINPANSIIPENGSIPAEPGVLVITGKSFLVSSQVLPGWKMVIGRDIVVTVTHSSNPVWKEIEIAGLSPGEVALLLSGDRKNTWKSVLGSGPDKAANGWIVNNPEVISMVADFLPADQEKLYLNEVGDIENFLYELALDRFAIGFCRLSDIYQPGLKEVPDFLSFIPVDQDGDNLIEGFEDIYNSPAEIARAAWIGKYPRTLFSNIYAVSDRVPVDGGQQAFLEWILTGGQEYLANAGYSGLVSGEQFSKLSALHRETPVMAGLQDRPVRIGIILIVSGIGIFVIFLVYLFVRLFIPDDGIKEEITRSGIPGFGENTVLAPGGLFYDISHTWTFMEKDGLVRTGIDDFLQHVTGPLTRIILKPIGEKINRGETFLSIVQYGKKLDLKSPVSGTIMECNTKLLHNTELLNRDPYLEGWIYLVEPVNWLGELRSFQMSVSYREWLKNEFNRLRDFLSLRISHDNARHLQLVLQEGGELKDGFMEWFGPEFWEEFQVRFINTSR